MGLDIVTSDYAMDFHIGYIGFTTMRSYFVLHYGKDVYDDYMELCRHSLYSTLGGDADCIVDEDKFDEKIGDLSILINHSDCDGKLSSDECKLLKECLSVDEDKIKDLEGFSNNPEYTLRIIKLMYEFIGLVEYCAGNVGCELWFG